MDTRDKVIINSAAATLAVVGFLNPVPGLDMVFILATWAGMLASMAVVYNRSFDAEAFKITMWQILKSIGIYLLGVFAFLTVTKLTGVGTFPAAFANALLNYSFTLVVGKMYQEAWAAGREPEANELETRLRAAALTIKHSLDAENRQRLKIRFEELNTAGLDKKDALLKLFEEEFGTF